MTPDEQAILNKAKENLEAAELLLDQGFAGIAASRTYYAMFYLAEALLIRKGLHFSSHSAVIAAFGKEYAKTGEIDSRYHQYLIKAQSIRQISDYGFNESLPKEDVEQLIEWARAFYQATIDYLC
jgi:uncharacterized protein (UPF0332 family)